MPQEKEEEMIKDTEATLGRLGNYTMIVEYGLKLNNFVFLLHQLYTTMAVEAAIIV